MNLQNGLFLYTGLLGSLQFQVVVNMQRMPVRKRTPFLSGSKLRAFLLIGRSCTGDVERENKILLAEFFNLSEKR